MVLKAIDGEGQAKFDLPIHASDSPSPHPLEQMYVCHNIAPKTGKPYVMAGVITGLISDGEHSHLLVDTIRIGGDYDGERANLIFWMRDFAGFSLFRDRKDWLDAVQRRVAKLKK